MSPLVFISYSSQNTQAARAVYDYLNRSLAAKGVKCWIAPDDIVAGMEFGEALVNAINDCRALVLIFSSHANASPQVRREVERAVSKGKVIIPVRIEDVMPSKAMEFCLGNTHWLDAITPSLEAHLERLATSVHTMLGAIGSLKTIRPVAAGPAPGKVAGAVAKLEDPVAPPKMVPPEVPVVRKTVPAGAISLEDLDDAAGKVVENARMLATRCRSAEISHRLLLAALVADAEGFASRACREGGVDPHLLWALLISMSQEAKPKEAKKKKPEDEDEAWEEVQLTPATCKRILTPTLERARVLAAGGKVSERHLFQAFCDKASPGFMAFLKAPGEESLELLQADLAELRGIDPDKPGFLASLSVRARYVVKQAHQLAMKRGVTPIPNRLLLAAFLLDEHAIARVKLAGQQVPVSRLCEELIRSVKGGGEREFPLEGQASARIISPVLKRAREMAGKNGLVTERLLLEAFCAVSDASMKSALKSAGVDLDALAAKPAGEPPPPQPAKPKLPFGGSPPHGLN